MRDYDSNSSLFRLRLIEVWLASLKRVMALLQPKVSLPMMTTYAVRAGADDGGWNLDEGEFTPHLPYLRGIIWLGYPVGFFVRFADAVILQGTTVQAGSLALTALQTTGGEITIPWRIYGVTGGSPVAPTSDIEAENLPLTNACVEWTPGVWTTGFAYTTPDLTPILQELADAGQAESGIMLVIRADVPYGDLSEGYRAFATFEHATANGPELTITTI